MVNLTPLKAIRKRCLDCSDGFEEVKNCACYENKGAIEKCPLHPYRFGKRPKEKAEFTPIKSIRKYYLWCCCGSFKQVKDCPVKDCPLWIYRMGKNPHRKGIGGSLKIPFKSQKSVVELEKKSDSEKSNIKLLVEK